MFIRVSQGPNKKIKFHGGTEKKTLTSQMCNKPFFILVTERVRENEAVKLIRLKEGLLKMSGAYIELVTQGGTLFTAQRVNT
jgi:hypothetical protein